MFYLEDDNHEEVNFNGEKMTFNSQFIRIWTFNWDFKKFETNSFCAGQKQNIVGGR